jgi:hypothetical protein
MKHAALAQFIPGAVSFLFKGFFSELYLFVKNLFPLPVTRPKRWRSLEHQVLEKMRRTILAWRLIQCTHIRKNLADDPRVAGALDDEESQAVVKYVFPNGKPVFVTSGVHCSGRKKKGAKHQQD